MELIPPADNGEWRVSTLAPSPNAAVKGAILAAARLITSEGSYAAVKGIFPLCRPTRRSHTLRRHSFKHLRPSNAAEWKIFRPRQSHVPCRRFHGCLARDHPCRVITRDKRRPQNLSRENSQPEKARKTLCLKKGKNYNRLHYIWHFTLHPFHP